ncbi:MAG: hypothetical protein UW27_C0008G0010 [Parcubacteria group bacterium GW2011_GWA1_44_13]|uniref:Uncharacterized protein n=1 Tax=Candidatus Nomurabacteria bacterium GW2011_GWB1_44_12 TaxID=1618748 RepID=A0A837IDC0_9BACT|nr:MAG: hypothetical protein UW17_C0026G0006 [Candidatus Nomurabacteria bacterium GW2011_GWD1_44_10]KKT36871.1 MAG: hypothetical protein UW25_C0004G0199 [Candidatus Nomurabacteria bacterium GW2011_GWB1_44_12]KKT37875.1 MAG: hypothetical protein UW27_C0008G0010 [Parcubacteria group bacterium GW2011_GWA1_44_13]
MKILAPFEKLFTPYALIALNLAIILSAEFVGGGTYFAETGLAHGIAIVFVGLIIVRIFSDYAFNDYILRGFLQIQLAFFLFLGLVHVYEYLGLDVYGLNPEVVELSVMASYLLWVLGILLALEFVFRIYSKRTVVFMSVISAVLVGGFLMLVGANISATIAESLPEWLPQVMLAGIVGLGIAGISAIRNIRELMPVFREYSHYAIPAIVLISVSAFSEYFESTGALEIFGVSEVQILYISHFLVYAALSLLLIGFGKLKKPMGIYTEM